MPAAWDYSGTPVFLLTFVIVFLRTQTQGWRGQTLFPGSEKLPSQNARLGTGKQSGFIRETPSIFLS